MEIKILNTELCILQQELINKMVGKFNMNDCKSAVSSMVVNFQVEEQEIRKNVPYRELIGGLLYVVTISRPGILYCYIS